MGNYRHITTNIDSYHTFICRSTKTIQSHLNLFYVSSTASFALPYRLSSAFLRLHSEFPGDDFISQIGDGKYWSLWEKVWRQIMDMAVAASETFFSSLPMHLFTFQYLGSAWAQRLFPSTSHHDFYTIRISPYIPWHHHPFLCPQVGRAMCWLSVSNRTINF